MSLFQEKVLSFLGINDSELDEYVRKVSFDDVENPYNFMNMEKVVDRINFAVKNNEKIMVYGDYDCDGISAVSILVKMFQYLNIKVGYYIPSRYIDGYGINLNRAKQIEEKGYSLVITVDNGVSACDAINYLTSKNIDVILTDHHDITRDLPNCYAVVHPDIKKNKMSLKQCGAYVAFMISVAVLGRIDEYLLTLAGQATIADMMPLVSYNRNIVKLSFDSLSLHKEYPQYLLNNNEIDEESFGYVICPKINAFGRIKEDSSVNDMVRFFVSNDVKDQCRIAKEVELINNYRKKVLSDSLNKLDLSIYKDKKIIIVRIDDISEGVIGLVASRILNECNKPCIVFTKVHNDNVLKGSARSLKGFSLSNAFSILGDLLLVYGGHEEAGGLSLDICNYEKFCVEMERLVENVTIEIEEDKYIELDNEDINYHNYLFLKSLSPFGMCFSKPKFLLNIDSGNLMFIGNNKQHIKGILSSKSSYIGFSMSSLVDGKSSFKALGQINYDSFKKKDNVVFLIEKII